MPYPKKIMPSRDEVLEILQAGPARFIDLAKGSRAYWVRKPLRETIDALVADGLVELIYLEGQQRYALVGWTPSNEDLLEIITNKCRRTIDGCLEWTGYIDPRRGPMYRLNDVPTSIRRLVWAIKRGRKLHFQETVKPVECDNWACVEYAHLALSRREDAITGKPRTLLHSMRIAHAHRAMRGVITMEIARQIRASNSTEKEEAKKWGISTATVGQVRRGEIWKEYGLFTSLLKAAA